VFKVEAEHLYWDLTSISSIKSPKEAATEFEAYLFNLFLKEVESVPGSLFGSTYQFKLFKSLFNMEIAQKVAESEPLGLSTLIERALKAYGGVAGNEG